MKIIILAGLVQCLYRSFPWINGHIGLYHFSIFPLHIGWFFSLLLWLCHIFIDHKLVAVLLEVTIFDGYEHHLRGWAPFHNSSSLEIRYWLCDQTLLLQNYWPNYGYNFCSHWHQHGYKHIVLLCLTQLWIKTSRLVLIIIITLILKLPLFPTSSYKLN